MNGDTTNFLDRAWEWAAAALQTLDTCLTPLWKGYIDGDLHSILFTGFITFAGFLLTAKMWMAVNLRQFILESKEGARQARILSRARRSGTKAVEGEDIADLTPLSGAQSVVDALGQAVTYSVWGGGIQLLVPLAGTGAFSRVLTLATLGSTLFLGLRLVKDMRTVTQLVGKVLHATGNQMIDEASERDRVAAEQSRPTSSAVVDNGRPGGGGSSPEAK